MMDKLQMPKYEPLSEEDWDFFFSIKPEDYILSIDESLRNKNRFFLDNRFNKLLYYYATNEKAVKESVFIIPKGEELYRARLYRELNAEEKAKCAKDGEFNGYDKVGSFIPPSNNICGQGRSNPRGIVYLYIASTSECAVQEVSPAVGDWVSVAKIRFNEEARIFNLAKTVLFSTFDDNDESKWATGIMSQLQSLFSRPFRIDGDYLICQYVSEFLKNAGYDGIRYLSSKVLQTYCDETYVNYTIFNYKKCEPVSSDLLYVLNSKIETITYKEKDSMTYHGECTISETSVQTPKISS